VACAVAGCAQFAKLAASADRLNRERPARRPQVANAGRWDSFWRVRLTGFVPKPQDRRVVEARAASVAARRLFPLAPTSRECTLFLAGIPRVSLAAAVAGLPGPRVWCRASHRGIEVALEIAVTAVGFHGRTSSE
jgi:hypothetical protein